MSKDLKSTGIPAKVDNLSTALLSTGIDSAVSGNSLINSHGTIFSFLMSILSLTAQGVHPISSLPTTTLIAFPTGANGNCCLHSPLGKWSFNKKKYICPAVKKKRQYMRKKILAIADKAERKEDRRLRDLAIAGVRELIMAAEKQEITIGSSTAKLREKYLSSKEFNWDIEVNAEVIKEYAEDIGKNKRWVLPHELEIIAILFKITIHFYPVKNAEVIILNEGKKRTVNVQFNGINHFERLETLEQHKLNIQKSNQSTESKLPNLPRVLVEKNHDEKEIKNNSLIIDHDMTISDDNNFIWIERILNQVYPKDVAEEDFESFLLSCGVIPIHNLEIITNQLKKYEINDILLPEKLMIESAYKLNYNRVKNLQIFFVKYKDKEFKINAATKIVQDKAVKKLYIYFIEEKPFLLLKIRDYYETNEAYAFFLKNNLLKKNVMKNYFYSVIKKVEISQWISFVDTFLDKVITANSLPLLNKLIQEYFGETSFLIDEIIKIKDKVNVKIFRDLIQSVQLTIISCIDEMKNSIIEAHINKCSFEIKRCDQEIIELQEILEETQGEILLCQAKNFEDIFSIVLMNYDILKFEYLQSKILSFTDFEPLIQWINKLNQNKKDKIHSIFREISQLSKLKLYYVGEKFDQLKSEMIEVFRKPKIHSTGATSIEIIGHHIVLDSLLDRDTLVKELEITFKDCQKKITIEQIKTIEIKAGGIVYVGENIICRGKDIVLECARIEFCKAVKIDTSGTDAKPWDSLKAADGRSFRPNPNMVAGRSGENGKDGGNGEDGGNLQINAIEIVNLENLEVCANGGNGADGQSGGDGDDGIPGEDGKDGYDYKSPRTIFTLVRNAAMLRGTNDPATKGLPGERGGNGGSAGRGGRAGQPGHVVIRDRRRRDPYPVKGLLTDLSFGDPYAAGKAGKEGNPGQTMGRGGSGGRGGHRGVGRGSGWEAFGRNEKFENGELDIKTDKNWIGMTRRTLVKLESEEEVKKRRAITGSRGNDGKLVIQEHLKKSTLNSIVDRSGLCGQFIESKLLVAGKDYTQDSEVRINALEKQIGELSGKKLALEEEREIHNTKLSYFSKISQRVSIIIEKAIAKISNSVQVSTDSVHILRDHQSQPLNFQKIIDDEKEILESKMFFLKNKDSLSDKILDEWGKSKVDLLKNSFLITNKSFLFLVESQLECLESKARHLNLTTNINSQLIKYTHSSILSLCEELKLQKITQTDGEYYLSHFSEDVETGIYLYKNPQISQSIIQLFNFSEDITLFSIALKFRQKIVKDKDLEKYEKDLNEMREKRQRDSEIWVIINRFLTINLDKAAREGVVAIHKMATESKISLSAYATSRLEVQVLAILSKASDNFINLFILDKKPITKLRCYLQFEKFINLFKKFHGQNLLLGQNNEVISFCYIYHLLYEALNLGKLIKLPSLYSVVSDSEAILLFFKKLVNQFSYSEKTVQNFEECLNKIVYLLKKMKFEKIEDIDLYSKIMNSIKLNSNTYQKFSKHINETLEKHYKKFQSRKLKLINNRIYEGVHESITTELMPLIDGFIQMLASVGPGSGISYKDRIQHYEYLLASLDLEEKEIGVRKIELNKRLRAVNSKSSVFNFPEIKSLKKINISIQHFNSSQDSKAACGFIIDLSSEESLLWFSKTENLDRLYPLLVNFKF